jgi:hypothetical protein
VLSVHEPDETRTIGVMRAIQIAVANLCRIGAMVGVITLCVRSGAVLGQLASRQRATQPAAFWTYVTIWAAFAFSGGFIISLVAIPMMFAPN